MNKKIYIYLFLIILAACATYSNHFHNPFHFDDAHTIENNIHIRNIKNIPSFFKDASTFSSNPFNQTYRPITSTTLAIDYYLAGGLNTLYFHLSMFFWFLVQLVLMFFLYKKLLSFISNHSWDIYFVLFAVAWYALHTVNAETLNYIISRSDSLSTLSVVVGLYIYIRFPLKRKRFLYLIPVVLGILTKEQAVMFVPILFFYILLFESKMSLYDIFQKKNAGTLLVAINKTIPSILVCGLMGVMVVKMQSDTFTPGGTSVYHYFITQPWVYLRYFIAFFIPVNLSADTDWKAIEYIFDERVIVGFSFMFLLIYFAFKSSKNALTKPISWGILWFIFALLPTSSIVPLAEVTNDHRMFFPFVGLALAVVWRIRIAVLNFEKEINKNSGIRYLVLFFAFLILAGNAYGVRERNKVWSSAESLWYDVSLKSPKNGRGLMNYGLALMRRGDFHGALEQYNKALIHTPYYTYLFVNIAIANNALGLINTAEENYLKAIKYGPNYDGAYYFYASFLKQRSRVEEARIMAQKAYEMNNANLNSAHLLMEIYAELELWDALEVVAQNTLALLPNDDKALRFLDAAKKRMSKSDIALEETLQNPTPESYVNLSLIYYNQGLYEKCIEACEEALKLRPDYYIAYNNICSAYNALGEWQKAIDACKKALEINPDFTLASNNLNYAISRVNNNN